MEEAEKFFAGDSLVAAQWVIAADQLSRMNSTDFSNSLLETAKRTTKGDIKPSLIAFRLQIADLLKARLGSTDSVGKALVKRTRQADLVSDIGAITSAYVEHHHNARTQEIFAGSPTVDARLQALSDKAANGAVDNESFVSLLSVLIDLNQELVTVKSSNSRLVARVKELESKNQVLETKIVELGDKVKQSGSFQYKNVQFQLESSSAGKRKADEELDNRTLCSGSWPSLRADDTMSCGSSLATSASSGVGPSKQVSAFIFSGGSGAATNSFSRPSLNSTSDYNQVVKTNLPQNPSHSKSPFNNLNKNNVNNFSTSKSTQHVGNNSGERFRETVNGNPGNKRRKQIVVKGTGFVGHLSNDRAVKAVARRYHYFTTRWHPDMSKQDVIDTVEGNIRGVKVLEIEPIQLRHKLFLAFRITTEAHHDNKMMSSTYWPESVEVRRYFFRKQRAATDMSTSSGQSTVPATNEAISNDKSKSSSQNGDSLADNSMQS